MPEVRIHGLGVGEYAPGTIVNVTVEEAATFVKDGLATYVNEADAVAPAAEKKEEEFTDIPPVLNLPPLNDGQEGSEGQDGQNSPPADETPPPPLNDGQEGSEGESQA